jgi:hypothetical protein
MPWQGWREVYKLFPYTGSLKRILRWNTMFYEKVHAMDRKGKKSTPPPPPRFIVAPQIILAFWSQPLRGGKSQKECENFSFFFKGDDD